MRGEGDPCVAGKGGSAEAGQSEHRECDAAVPDSLPVDVRQKFGAVVLGVVNPPPLSLARKSGARGETVLDLRPWGSGCQNVPPGWGQREG